ncbi:MAG TPA: prolipoprotein diacylglyceryl transferase [Oceanospirillales bacterium]|nr:prolipoprotein diacylglyceryl transferase [Oceanospirillales bacterium]
MHYLVNFDPVFLNLGPIKIHWYAISYLIGFAFFVILGNYKVKHENTSWTKEQVSDFLFYGGLGVILGGRIGWVLFYNDTPFAEDPLLLFKVQNGGMSFHGGLAGVIIAMLYFKYKTNKGFFEIADFVAPISAIGIGSVRIGNFINGELWGRLTNKPWGMIFPDSLPAHLQTLPIKQLQEMNQQGLLDEFARHPSPLYESFLEGFVTFIIVWLVAKRFKRAGIVSGTFLICYGLSRFTVEFFRQPDANRGFVAFDWMTMGQILTIPIIILGVIFISGILTKNDNSQ